MKRLNNFNSLDSEDLDLKGLRKAEIQTTLNSSVNPVVSTIAYKHSRLT